MIGVNIDNLNTLIKKNNFYFNSYNSNSKKLVNSMNELNECYSGNSLNYLFTGPMNEVKNVQTITKIIKNYSDILYGVKISYEKQDEIFKTQISRMNSKL